VVSTTGRIADIDLHVAGSLHIRDCPHLVELPPLAQVWGTLRLSGCPRLARLPKGLTVQGDLLLESCSSLPALPAGLNVGGSLRIRGCSALAEIPDGVVVGGDLVVVGRGRLRRLSERVVLGGSIVLKHAAPSLEGRRKIAGTLALIAHPALEALPEGLALEGDLVIRRCPKLRALPAGLRVGGGLEWRHAPIRTLPPDLQLGDFLDLEGSSLLEALPPGLRVPGWLRLRDCRSLRDLGEGLRVGVGPRPSASWTPWAYSRIGPRPARRELLRPGQIDLTGCEALARLPDDLQASTLELAGTRLRSLPADARLRLRWRGVDVPAQVIVAPESYAPQDVLKMANAEVRRVLIDRLGLAHFLALLQPEVLDADTDPGGQRQLLVARLPGDREPYVALSCRCPSTGRSYLLRVPPTVRTCRAAAAWLAGFSEPDAYRPVLET
jgi:hypothetical protein